MKKQILTIAVAATMSGAVYADFLSSSHNWNGGSSKQVYNNFPVTLKSYTGSKTNSVSYTGQMARQVLHDSLKKLASKGDKSAMMKYFAEKGKDRKIIAPATKGDFKVKQTTVGEISNPDLKGKTYKGSVPGWFGMTGQETIEFMIDKAANSKGGYDVSNGYDYTQLISKTLMGAVFYNQIANNYLAGKLEANKKPNNKPYKDGKHYTGKEHSWDEGFGYFGAPAHGLSLTPEQIYGIAKKKDMAAADYNKDGVVDLYNEMVYTLSYYAAAADKSGKTSYFKDTMQAYIDGRQLIADAKGEVLSDAQRNQLKGYAGIVKENIQKILAEATFKYAGSVYKDINTLNSLVDNGGDTKKAYRKYIKHWGELKGFSLAMQMGDKNLGEVATKLNRLIGNSPVLLGDTQVKSLDRNGDYVQADSESMKGYMVHMLKVQKLLAENMNIKARLKDQTAGLDKLVKSLGAKAHAEND